MTTQRVNYCRRILNRTLGHIRRKQDWPEPDDLRATLERVEYILAGETYHDKLTETDHGPELQEAEKSPEYACEKCGNYGLQLDNFERDADWESCDATCEKCGHAARAIFKVEETFAGFEEIV